ncbi:ion transporter [Catelliglobosispora koreensis]|uniref:ion transporter n=1 Tax=Catelliglobosispora koreensis TaxID=129052 RepID=UPI00037953B2|nr:ion transporter [Catelliglobosispora koreensis]
MSNLTAALHRIAHSRAFNGITVGVILFNALLLGLQTYPRLEQDVGSVISTLDHLCLAFFIVELAIRIGAHGSKPMEFFKSGWNLFDFAIVVAALLPGIRENITLLRLARLARILRSVRIFPQMRIIMVAIGRSIPGALSLLMVALMVLYIYAMLGWILFHEAFPEQYGTIGTALVSLFCLLALDDLTNVVRPAYDYSAWTLVYYISFVVFAALVLLNILLGVVINSMEEAREMEAKADAADDPMHAKIEALYQAANDLRAEYAQSARDS